MKYILKYIFFIFFVRPLIFLFVGLRVKYRDRLPKEGPYIIAANHNSHLDTVVLMSILPIHMLSKARPIAARDYFFKNPFLKWFSQIVIGIIPFDRKVSKDLEQSFQMSEESLKNKEIIIIFPEGSRGEPENLTNFKSGIARLASSFPNIPIVPVYLYGLGKILPRGTFIPVPFLCHVYVGEKLYWDGKKKEFMDKLFQSLKNLALEGKFPPLE